MWTSSAFALALAATAYAVPTTHERRSVTQLSASDLSALAPYTQFARAAYCPTSKLTGWNCGEACSATSGFQPTLVGGDGNAIQQYFVGYWPSKNTVVVGHEGTDPTKLVSVLTDANILMDPLDTALFPGTTSNVKVHDGFRNEHALTAKTILAEVKRLMSAKGTSSITVVGHSLGGALAELDALYFSLNVPSAKITLRTFGTPRVGNTAFASLLDSKVTDNVRTNNEKDIVPIVPGRFLGFAHGQHEVHIVSANNAVACSGADNADDAQCTIQTVPNIFVGNILNHLGPYQGIYIGTIFCT